MSLISMHAGVMVLGGNAVSFISSTGANYVASGTTINTPSTPAGIQNNDGLFAIYIARSAVTPPSGWTLVASQNNPGTVNQTLYVYRKNTVSTSDSSTAFTWTQATTNRAGLAYLVVRSTSGTITVAGSSGAMTDYAVSTAYPQNVTVPSLSASMDGELFIIAAGAEVASATASTNTWIPASGATLQTIATQAENRLAGFTQSRNTGQSNATPLTFNALTASSNYYSCLTIRLQP